MHSDGRREPFAVIAIEPTSELWNFVHRLGAGKDDAPLRCFALEVVRVDMWACGYSGTGEWSLRFAGRILRCNS